MSKPLAHTLVRPDSGTVDHWLLLLHGIFGTRANWRGFAKSLMQCKPGTAAILLDLRMHGDSLDYPTPHTLDACAQDVLSTVEYLVQSEELQGAEIRRVLGHSFGGKVALELCRPSRPQVKGFAPTELWMVDVAPGLREIIHTQDSPWAVLRVLEHLASDFTSRGEFVAALQERSLSEPLAQWLAMNLRRAKDGRYRWPTPPAVFRELLSDFARNDLWSVIEDVRQVIDVRFVVAGRSTSWNAEQLRQAEQFEQRSIVQIHRLEKSGHWVHVDDPRGLRELMLQASQ